MSRGLIPSRKLKFVVESGQELSMILAGHSKQTLVKTSHAVPGTETSYRLA